MGQRFSENIVFEICIPEGRGGEKGGSANFQIKYAEPLTQDSTPIVQGKDNISVSRLNLLFVDFEFDLLG